MRERRAWWRRTITVGWLVGILVQHAWISQVAGGQEKILFRSDRDGDEEIYMMDVNGANVVQLTNNTVDDKVGSVSPDGARIVFTSTRNGEYDLYTMNIDGTDVVQLTDNPGYRTWRAQWSPDGTRIAFSRRIGVTARTEHIAIVNADGSNLIELTDKNNNTPDENPFWSPDGSKIGFNSHRYGTWAINLFTMDPDGSNVVRLTNNSSYWLSYVGQWSPDGSKIAYSDGVSGANDDIWTMDADGSNRVRLTYEGASSSNVDAHWSPDGTRIAFFSNRDGDHEIYAMDSDGANVVQLTDNTSVDVSPVWFTANIPVAVSLPDTVATYDQSLEIPVRVGDTTGQDIVSAELFLAYDGDLLTAVSAAATGTLLIGDWAIETNIVEGIATNIDTIKMAMATDEDALTGAGTLIHVNFQVADIRHPASSPLTLTHVLLNDGDPENAPTDGSVTLVGIDGVITSLPAEILPRWSIGVSVYDIDEDRDIGTRDAFAVAVTNDTQTETLMMTETGPSTGVFSGVIGTVFSLAPTSGDGIVQAKAGDQVVFTYADSLDADGETEDRTDATDVIGGTDGLIRTTVVSQPGDTVRVRVSDADLSDAVAVSVANPRTGETESILLSQFTSGESHFYGRFFTGTQAGAVGDSTLEVAKGDTLTITYGDTLTANGGTAAVGDDDEVVDPFGDAHPNGSVQAFDAAQVLIHRLSTYGGGAGTLSGLDSLSANGDQSAPFGIIDGYDASLVLRKVVGLIDRFEVQAPDAVNHPQSETAARPKPVPRERRLALIPGEGYVSVWCADRSEIVSGELTLAGVQGQVVMGEELPAFLSMSRETRDGVRIVFAGAQSVSGPGELLRIRGVGA